MLLSVLVLRWVVANLYIRQSQPISHVYRSDVTDSIKFYCAELPSWVLLDAAVQRVMTEHSYAQLPLSKR